jgi:hypothetical protein
MKARVLLAVLMSGAMCSAGLAQQPKQKESKPTQPATQPSAKPDSKQPDEQQMMKAMEEAGKPGKFHEYLQQLAGNWDCTVKYKMGPGAEWKTSNATAYGQMWYDGRYLHESVKGEFEGKPFKGQAFMGYNNLTKKYESAWIDSESTMITNATGTCDGAGKVFTMVSDCVDPMTGKPKRTREVTTVKSPDQHVTEFYDQGPDGREFKMMEITYNRTAGKSEADEDERGKGKEKDKEKEKH